MFYAFRPRYHPTYKYGPRTDAEEVIVSGFFDQASPPTKPYVLSFPVIYFTHTRTNRRFLASSSLVQISLFLRTTSLRTVVSICPH